MEATLVKANLSRFCPVTNLYSCSDGKHLLVTVTDAAQIMAMVEAKTGIPLSVEADQVPTGTEVFLADNRGRIIDADDNPLNGMTALQTFPAGTTFDAALEALGYEVT